MNLTTDLTSISRIAAGAIPVAVAIVGLTRGPGSVRSRLRHDLELLEKFPADTDARRKFEEYLSGQVDRFTKLETESSRDIQGLIISAVLVIAIGAASLWLFSLGHWYWWLVGIVAALLAIAGLTSMYDDAQKVPRDDQRKPL